MPNSTLTSLVMLAAFIGVIHTLMGPDHYLPFIAMSRARKWSLTKTLSITLGCGIGHVLGSLVLGSVGIAVGLAVGGLEIIEAYRSEMAAWLLLGFGVAYTAWGVRRAVRNRPHSHFHAHADGTVHRHEHTHVDDHAHVHAADDRSCPDRPHPAPSLTPWILFAIFVFGPCETLIPLLMYPAAQRSWWALIVVVVVFALTTLATMTATVAACYIGLDRAKLPHLGRYAHATTGLALTACALAIFVGL